jgi:hypothetical protein
LAGADCLGAKGDHHSSTVDQGAEQKSLIVVEDNLVAEEENPAAAEVVEL